MDRDLVELAQRGDRDAYAILAKANGDRLMGVAHRILRDFDRAEDAVQQTLVIAWRELPALRDPDRFEAWLHRLLVHACYAESRRARAWRGRVVAVPDDGPTTDDTSIAVAQRDQLERGFRRLTLEQRSMLVLHHYLGLNPSEIAETLGIPSGTARSRLHYAHRAMRAALEADDRREAIGGLRA